MKKVFKIIGILLLVGVIIALIMIYSQPSEAHVERSIVINTPAAQVFHELNTFKTFNEWSPWAKMDPTTKYAYEGPESGVGARMSWEGEKVGKGSQWIEESTPDQHIKNGMSFDGYDTKYSAAYTLTPEGNGTKVTWSYDGPNEGFMGKMLWLFMKGMLGDMYEQGLHDLKAYVESKPAPAPEPSPVENDSTTANQ